MIPLYRFGNLIIQPNHIISYTIVADRYLGVIKFSGDYWYGVPDNPSGHALHDWIISQSINPQEQKDAGQV